MAAIIGEKKKHNNIKSCEKASSENHITRSGAAGVAQVRASRVRAYQRRRETRKRHASASMADGVLSDIRISKSIEIIIGGERAKMITSA